MTQHHSEQFGFTCVENLRVAVDNLKAYRAYLDLAIDTILGIKPVPGERVSDSQIKRELERKGHIHPSIEQKEDGRYYLKDRPVHYWFDESDEPLLVGIAGSGYEVKEEEVEKGRSVFQDRYGLSRYIMALLSRKKYKEDVLAHVNPNQFRGMDINEADFKSVVGVGEVTGHDFKGGEDIGYTIEEEYHNPKGWGCGHNVLKIGLCRAYYSR